MNAIAARMGCETINLKEQSLDKIDGTFDITVDAFGRNRRAQPVIVRKVVAAEQRAVGHAQAATQ